LSDAGIDGNGVVVLVVARRTAVLDDIVRRGPGGCRREKRAKRQQCKQSSETAQIQSQRSASKVPASLSSEVVFAPGWHYRPCAGIE
jgi:hypothetical protein